jgi:hypothetical protein
MKNSFIRVFSTSFFICYLLFTGTQLARADIELSANWDNPEKTAVKVFIIQHDESMEECRQSGAEVYYRYETEMCVRRKSWGENCKKVLINTRTLNFDPITETYSVVSDRWGDDDPAEKHSYTEWSQALSSLSEVTNIPVSLDQEERRRQFMNAKVRFICKGQSSALLSRLSQIITLGIAPAEGIDSGWQEFDFPTS